MLIKNSEIIFSPMTLTKFFKIIVMTTMWGNRLFYTLLGILKTVCLKGKLLIYIKISKCCSLFHPGILVNVYKD